MISRIVLRTFAFATLFVSFAQPPLAAQGVTPQGVVGEYTPPRVWPVRVRSFDLLHQRIAVKFDVPHRLVSGEVTSRLTLLGAASDSIRFDAGNLTIDAATDPAGHSLRFRYDTSSVTVHLRRKAALGDTVVFTLRYHTVPERGIYFVPRRGVIWSQGEATETRNWIPTYDASNDKATWEFLVTADSGESVLSNGRLVEVLPGADAAHKVWHWSQETPASTYLYSIVVGRLTILHDQWRGIPVEYWVDPDSVAAGWRTFGETPSMIETYSRVLGVNFPWAKYDQSVIPDFTYGGMENVSATTQTDLVLHTAGGEPEQSGRGLAAHELAHQWFGDLTTTATWAHAWLNEGLTTYMESVHEEKSRGWAAAQLNWWGQQQQAMGADVNNPRPLVWGKYEGDDPIALFFSGHIYPKGAQVAHQLRRLLGDSVFWAGMHRFLTDNAYQPVETRDYAIAFEKTCNCDLDWFFNQWAYGIGYPKVVVTRHWDEAGHALHLTVAQTQAVDSTHPLFRFPVTVRIVTRDSVVRKEIMVSKPSETFDLALPGAPLSVRFDEGGWLLGKVSTDFTSAELAEMARHDLDFSARIWALNELEGKHDSVAVETRRFLVLNESQWWLRQQALIQMAEDKGPASVEASRSALRDPDSRVRIAALQTLAALDSAGANAPAKEMAQSDPNVAVRATALRVYTRDHSASALSDLVAETAVGLPTGFRQIAANVLGKYKDPKATEALERLTVTTEPRNLRMEALNDVVKQGDSARATALATRYLGDYDPLFAVAAVRALARIGGETGKATLRAALPKETRVTVRAAIQAGLNGPGT